MDTVLRVLAGRIKVQRACPHRITWSARDTGGKRAEPRLFAGGGGPCRPFFLTADLGDAAPGLRFFAHSDAIADRFALRQDVIKKLVVGIDEDRAAGLAALIIDDLPAVALRN